MANPATDQPPPKAATPAGDRQKERRLAKRLLLGALLLVLLWLGFKMWRIASLAQSLLARQTQAEQIMANGFSSADPDAIEALVYGVRGDVAALHHEARPFAAVGGLLGWLPAVGPSLAAAPHLLDMADSGTEAAAYAVRGLKPAIALLQEDASGSPVLPALMQIVAAAAPDLAQASAAMDEALAARARIQNSEALPGRVRQLLDLFDHRGRQVSEFLKLAQVLPGMAGLDGPRTYLIIAQNQDELRPTGGFFSGVGLLVMDNGQIVSVDFSDASAVGKWWEKPFDFPPQPLYDLMGLELFLLRDANFWPDFPVSAEQAIDLYSYSEDVPPPDGVIALDQTFVAMLLGLTGPLDVPELGVRVNQRNVIDELRSAWQIQEGQSQREWVSSRKEFMGPFAAALRTRLESGLGSIDPLFLADTLETAITTGHLQVYVRDPAGAALLDALNWDGRLENPAGQDFLLVVDTNVGYNKTNPFIESSLTYAVTLASDGPAVANLDLVYRHTRPDNGQPCFQGTEAAYVAGDDYAKLLEGCYFNYLRLYTPAGIELLDATRHFAPAEAFLAGRGWDRPAQIINEHPDFSTIVNFFLLPYAQELTSSYRYQLPANVVQAEGGAQRYLLTLATQAGAPPRPVTVEITLPPGTSLLSAEPPGIVFTPATGSNPQTVTYFLDQTTNQIISVTYR